MNARDVTPVVFRAWRNGKGNGEGIIALFPRDTWRDSRGVLVCQSFEHVGQHGGADYSHVIRATRPAQPQEFAALKRELEGVPYCYALRVLKRARLGGAA
jgi:hypothetical protein